VWDSDIEQVGALNKLLQLRLAIRALAYYERGLKMERKVLEVFFKERYFSCLLSKNSERWPLRELTNLFPLSFCPIASLSLKWER
jgi:hypothetical protein